MDDLKDIARRLSQGETIPPGDLPHPLSGHFSEEHEIPMLLNALTDEMGAYASRARYHLTRKEPYAALLWVRRWQRASDEHDRVHLADAPRRMALWDAHEAECEAERQKRARYQPTIAPEVLNAPTTRGFTIHRAPALDDIVMAPNAPHGFGRCANCGDLFSPRLEDTAGYSWCVECLPTVAAGRLVTGTLPELCGPCAGQGSVKAREDETVEIACVECAGRGIAVPKEVEVAEKLDVFGWHGSYRISWSEDGDEGLILGPGLLREFSGKPEMADTVCAVNAIFAMPDDARRIDGSVWLWESEAKARQALKVARHAMKVHESKIPWPEWAKHALAEGWKPPKGWKPPLPSIPNPESEK